MLLPIRTSIRPERVPYANYALIAVNVLVFMMTYVGGEHTLRPFARSWILTPAYPFLWQFITYAFLHGSFMHIFGNMFFLYIFGNNVNARLGHIGYLCFYLAGAVFSAVGHILAASLYGSGVATSVLGASGAVAAVTGAYMVLFPQSLITIVYWFFFIGTMDLPAIYLIIFKMIFIDNIIARSAQNVAYDAHLAGYVFGIGSIILMLAVRLIRPDHLDLWSMLHRWNLRRQYTDAVSGGGDDAFGGRIRKKIKVKEVKETPEQKAREEKIMALRSEITTRISQSNLSAACDSYLELEAIAPKAILPKQAQLDIANQLMTIGKWQFAAEAYEKFITHYKNYEYPEQIHLMLGIIYARYIKDTQKAEKYLNKALPRLSDESQKKMCSNELEQLA